MSIRSFIATAAFALFVLHSAPAAADDVVYLRNGTSVRGELKELVPGQRVVLLLPNGESKEVTWPEIDRVVTGETPGQTPAPPPPHREPEPWTDLEAPAQPRTEWRANRPLLVTGAIAFGLGYVPNLAVALPSTLGLVGRVLLYVFSVGLVPLGCALGNGTGYICRGQHGAMQLLIPVAGPFSFASDHPRDSVVNERGETLSGATKGVLYTSAGLQIAGLTSILLAVVFGKQEPVPARKTTLGPSFFVTPMANGDAMGLSVGVHRW